jgi:hypothetical protein
MDKFEPFTFDPTAFMSGQMESKLWLCDALYGTLLSHGLLRKQGAYIHILAGWYGLTNVLLHAGRKIPISLVISYDADPEATHGALVLNESFHHDGQFVAITADINSSDYDPVSDICCEYPDIVINTSVEHVEGRAWFDEKIVEGTIVVIQSNDMDHLDEHVNTVKSVDDLAAQYEMSKVLFKGKKYFDYDTWGFNRFMVIGIK